ncbi:hypothetical protein BASA83_013653 [Batrachochytrium salamandrivorans]|nr:hypothetical protein BASA83_013653 [Batrachochytrium salamandrivorans]
MTTKKLTRRQARWSLELSEYDFTLTHRPGKLNGRADSLSRRHDYLSENDTSNFQRILDPKKVIDLQALMVDMDLHLLVHSVVPRQQFPPDLGRRQVYCSLCLHRQKGRHNESLPHFPGSPKSASGVHSPLPIRPVPPVALPFERWGIDFYGPMVETKSGNKYLITCIDYATRWVLAKPVKDMTESAVSAFLYELMMTYGAPFEIISDRGKSFLAEGIDLFERENRIRHLATTPYHPQTNEPEPTRSLNFHRSFSYLESIRVSQLTETPPQNTLAPLDDIEQMEENSEFIARNLEEVGQARSAANVRTKAQAEAMRKRNNFDETTPDYFFKVGDMVKMKHHDRLKLEFRWKAPITLSMLDIPEPIG